MLSVCTSRLPLTSSLSCSIDFNQHSHCLKPGLQHKHNIHSYASVSGEGGTPHEGKGSIKQETITVAPRKQRRRRTVFCAMSVGLTAPEERSRDHVFGAIIRQEGFQKGSALITGKHADST